jgi:hypothetical protein
MLSVCLSLSVLQSLSANTSSCLPDACMFLFTMCCTTPLASLRKRQKSSEHSPQTQEPCHTNTYNNPIYPKSLIPQLFVLQGDEMVSLLSDNGEVSIRAVTATGLVKGAAQMQATSPVASAALGRTIVCALMLAAGKKTAEMYGEIGQETVQIDVRGDGPLKQSFALADGRGEVAFQAPNPRPYLPFLCLTSGSNRRHSTTTSRREKFAHSARTQRGKHNQAVSSTRMIVSVTLFDHSQVRGYVAQPFVDLPPNNVGKLDVAAAVGVKHPTHDTLRPAPYTLRLTQCISCTLRQWWPGPCIRNPKP